MVFALVRYDGQYAVFDGTGDREGEHITYRRTTEGLTFVGDFLHRGKSVRAEVHMRKAANWLLRNQAGSCIQPSVQPEVAL